MNSVLPDTSQAGSKSVCFVSKLPNRRDFLRLRKGRRFSTPNFTLQAIGADSSTDKSVCRVGYTVTTRIGNAVVRNRIKRRLRAAVDEIFPTHGKAAHDYAIIARREALGADFGVIAQDLKRALDHVHSNKAKGGGKQARPGIIET